MSNQAYVENDICPKTEYNLYYNHVKNFVRHDIIFCWPVEITETAFLHVQLTIFGLKRLLNIAINRHAFHWGMMEAGPLSFLPQPHIQFN